MSISAEKEKDELARIQDATDYKVQRAEDGSIVGQFFNSWLSSVFQPVFDTRTRKTAGHAAYIRSALDKANSLSPWKIYAMTEGDALLVHFDRLCRAVHALNYFSGDSQRGALFVTVQPRLLESVKDDHGSAFERIVNIIGAETSRVVIEIPAEVSRNWKLLKHVISNYRSRGYWIATNHSGANGDWMAELASLYPLYPDMIRLEAPVLLKQGGMRSLVDAIHHFGAQVLVHEIETTQQLNAALHAGVDFLQGSLLGIPAQSIEAEANEHHLTSAERFTASSWPLSKNPVAVGVQDVYV